MHPSGLGGFAVKCRLSEDNSRVEAVEERYAVSAENTHNTKYLDGDAWINWFQMHTGLDIGAPTAFLSDPCNPSTSATNKMLSKVCTLTMQNGQLQVQLDFGQYSFAIGWHSGDGLVSHDFKSVNGTLYKYDSTMRNGKGEGCKWTGIIATAHEHSAWDLSVSHQVPVSSKSDETHSDYVQPLTCTTPVFAASSMKLAESGMPMSTEGLAEMTSSDSDQMDNGTSESAQMLSVPAQPLTAATPAWAASSMKLMESEIPMSTEELAEMAPPDSEQVNKLSFAKITNLMKATVDSNTLATLLDDTPPTLSSEEQAIIDDPTNGSKARKFLAEKFFRAYAVQALSGSSQLEKDFSGVDGGVTTTKERLHYFWQGSGKADEVVTADASKATNILSQDPAFDFVNNGVARIAFTESLPALQRYLNDNPADWADKLYKYVSSTDYVNGLAVLTAVSDNSQLNKLCMILYALAPGKSYATDLCARVLEVQTNYMRQHFGSLNAALMKTIVPAIITKLVNLIDADDPSIKLSAQIKAEIVSQVRSAITESNSENAQAFVSKFQSLWEECAVFMSANRDQPVWQRLSDWWSKIGETYPKTTKLGSALVTLFGHAVWITTIGVSIMSLVVLGNNWNTFRTDQKVAIIAQGSAVLSDVIAKAEKAWNGLMDAFNFEDMFTFESVFEAEDLQELWGHYMDETAVEYNAEMDLGDLSHPGTGAAGAVAAEDVQAVRIWENFSVAGKVARLTNVVAMGAAVVSMGFQVSEDFKTNQPIAIKVLDIINVVAAGIGFAAETIALAGELGAIALSEFIAGAVIPIVGAVVAIVGVIVSIVLMFLHKKSKPPDTPIDKWIKGTGVTFVNQLPTPNAVWQNQHKDSTQE
ncbi:uncharacterized protein LOC134180135 [Corticium candelabrum]|uniref:uncharacterized protein LOC134180135 n=1 Tax=Corticium candelabrum TaxID=121492 RepID=UPI002E26E05A|nr:uncharacterized protein LOC134180135 [Corticium candelabrum]